MLKTLLDDTVFMTQVHEVLLSPFFLISGGYLGPYGLSLLLAQAPAKGQIVRRFELPEARRLAVAGLPIPRKL